MKTKMTTLLDIQYPIMQGGMQWIGLPKSAAAVSNAGGLGTINASCYPDAEEFREAIRHMKRLTNDPFAINISLTPETSIGEVSLRNIQIAGEEKVPVIETAGRPIGELRATIRKFGMIHIHKCTSVRHALRAQADGADLVTVIGYEAAGHPSPHEIGSFVLFNQAARGLSIPMLGGGGIADGRGLAAALALGCEGVVLGTRFVASCECGIHPNFKRAIVNSDEASTLTCQRSIKNMCRYYRNAQASRVLELEERGASLAEILDLVTGERGKACYQNGDTQGCCFSVGVGCSLIREVKPVKAILEEMMAEAAQIFAQSKGHVSIKNI